MVSATVHVQADMADILMFDEDTTHNFVKNLSMLRDKKDTSVEFVVMGGKVS